MLDYITTIVPVAFLTFIGLIFLDYIFCTEKLKSIRTKLCTEIHYCMFTAWLIIGTTLKLSALFSGTKMLNDMGNVIIAVMLFSIWAFYTMYYITRSIQYIRNINSKKRKKPL